MGIPAENLLKQPNLEEIETSIKKHGRFATILNQLQASLIPILVVIILSLLQFAYNQRTFKDLEQEIKTINQTIVNVDSDKNGAKGIKEIISKMGGEESALGNQTGFNPEQWIIEKFEKDSEGFYCPLLLRGFKYWSIWSKEKISPILPLKIRLRVKNKSSPDLTPTIIISYGEYLKNLTLITDYRISIFDTDYKSIRLYNEKNESIKQAWLEETPNLDNDMIFSLSPRSIVSKGRKLNLNPGLIYNPINSDSTIEFKPEVEFLALLPTVDIEDPGFKKQLGIGVKFGSCIKINAVEF